MSLPVVIAARRAAVVVGGGPARRPRLHVIDLGVFGGHVAEGVEALAIAYFDRSAGRAAEEPAAPAAWRRPARPGPGARVPPRRRLVVGRRSGPDPMPWPGPPGGHERPPNPRRRANASSASALFQLM